MTPKENFTFGTEPVVIRKYVHGFEGGRPVDLSDWPEDTLKAGHIITADSNGVLKPNPVSEGAFSALPTGCTYAGVLTTAVRKEYPFAAIMHTGDVNDKAMPYKLTDSVRTAMRAGIPTLTFHHD